MKKFFIQLISPLLLLTVCASCSFSNTVAFYRVPQIIQQETLKILTSSGQKYKAIQLDDAIPLTAQTKALKNSTILIAYDDFETDRFAQTSPRAKPMPAAYLTHVPVSIARQAVKYQNTFKSMPMLYDFYQLDVHYPLYKRSKVPTLDYWNDFIRVAKIEQNFTETPILFAGADDENFLNIFSMFAEAILGCDDYSEALELIYQACTADYAANSDDYANLIELLQDFTTPGGLFYPVLAEIRSLLDQKLLNPSSFTLKPDEAIAAVNNEQCGFFFTSLSNHYSIDNSVLPSYKSVYCPSYPFFETRKFIAPSYCAIALSGTKANLRQIVNLTSTQQASLSAATGYVPVQAKCAVRDDATEQARYFVAASDGPLKPLPAALTNAGARSFTSQYLRNLLVSF